MWSILMTSSGHAHFLRRREFQHTKCNISVTKYSIDLRFGRNGWSIVFSHPSDCILQPYRKQTSSIQSFGHDPPICQNWGPGGTLRAINSLSEGRTCPNLASLFPVPKGCLFQIWPRLLKVSLYLSFLRKICGALAPSGEGGAPLWNGVLLSRGSYLPKMNSVGSLVWP